ncbi:MAG: hypothetical protein PUF41_11480 [Prevotella copri]|nr:hypothetical protein [Segatella copri]
MKDIRRAVALENEYIQYRLNGEEPFSLADEIAKYGFATLEEYFDQKIEYMVSQTEFTIEDVYPSNAAESMLRLISSKKPGILLMDTDILVVYHGDEEFNRTYCEEHGIPVVDYYTHGGTLIASDGELSMGICMPNSTGVSADWMLFKLSDILSKYMDNVVVDKNDIMVNGKKVCGSTTYSNEDTFAFIAQFSFDDKSELISVICPPHKTGKVPGFITELTREQLRREVKEWLL